MSRMTVRKARERRVAQEKVQQANRRRYAQAFPQFVLTPNNAPQAFDDLNRTLTRQRYSVQTQEDTMARMKTADFRLPLYKQGDDLGHFLAEHDDVRGALLGYASMLNDARDMVVALAEHAGQLEIVQADTHMIVVEGPAKLIDKLIASGLLSPEYDDENGGKGEWGTVNDDTCSA